jgi:hypothetical protein
MTHRIRMARKRLMVARERVRSARIAFRELLWANMNAEPANSRTYRRIWTLRAIERRRDRIA